MKARQILSAIAAALILCGCSNAQAEKMTEPENTFMTSPTLQEKESYPAETTHPSEMTAPTETTVPQQSEQTQPQILTVEGRVVELDENVPYYDINSSDFIMVKEENYLDLCVRYIHFNNRPAFSATTYENGIFRVVEPGTQEYLSARNRYDLYELYDGELRKLKEQAFCREYTIFDESFTLELEYAVVRGQVMVTYEPDSRYDMARACVVNLDRGIHQALARFNLTTGVYYAIVNLETGELTHFLQELGPSTYGFRYPQHTLEKWLDDNSLVLHGEGKWFLVDANSMEVKKYTPDASEKERPKALTFITNDDRTLTVYDHRDNEQVELLLPEEWVGVDLYWDQREDKRQAACYRKNAEGVYQILLFDADSNTLYSICRTNTVWLEKECRWRNGFLYVIDEDLREMCMLLIE